MLSYSDENLVSGKLGNKDVRNFFNKIGIYSKRGKIDVNDKKLHYFWRKEEDEEHRLHYHFLANLILPSCEVHEVNRAYTGRYLRDRVGEYVRDRFGKKIRVKDCNDCYDMLKGFERFIEGDYWVRVDKQLSRNLPDAKKTIGWVDIVPILNVYMAIRYISKYMSKSNVKLSEKRVRNYGFSMGSLPRPKSPYKLVARNVRNESDLIWMVFEHNDERGYDSFVEDFSLADFRSNFSYLDAFRGFERSVFDRPFDVIDLTIHCGGYEDDWVEFMNILVDEGRVLKVDNGLWMFV